MNLVQLIFLYIIYYVAMIGVFGKDNVGVMEAIAYPAALILFMLVLRKLFNPKGKRKLKRRG